MRELRISVVALLCCLGLVALPAAEAAPAPAAPPAWTARGEQYPATVTQADVAIPMSDGLSLRGDLVRPADASGAVETTRLPVVVQVTAYNKSFVMSAGGLGGASPEYLVKRGYAYLLVDARGTGTSPGEWQVFGAREQLDAKEVMEWAADQPWSNGRTAMVGPSYMGISQLFAAGHRPKGLRAIFPQVPSAEVYRDVVASGGQLDVGFMPAWLGLVSGTSLMPSPTAPPEGQLAGILGHITGTGGTSLQLSLSALAGGERAYDGPWYRERSTLLRAAPHIDVPTFLVGGHYDLFQRGTPLIFQRLQERGVPVKMILGPWDHLEGSSGADVDEAGYGTLAELQLRWFDHYVKGRPDPALDRDIPDFTYYELGSGRWVARNHYLDEQVARVYRLSGTATTLGTRHGALTRGAVTDGRSTLLPVAAAGLCSRSASQWTAGATGALLPANPCDEDNSLNDRTGLVFETEPQARGFRMLGPIYGRFYTSSTTGDGLLAVHVSRVGPDGKVDRLTGGWQVMSMSALDRSRSVTLPLEAGPRAATREIVQPWHPFTWASKRVRRPGEVTPVDVEVFPTGAAIPAGHRLRVSIAAFDLPHLAPTLDQPETLGSVLTLHNSDRYPSRLVVPTFGRVAAPPSTGETDGPSTAPSPGPAPPATAPTAVPTLIPSGAGSPATSSGDGLSLTGLPVAAVGLFLVLLGWGLYRRRGAG